MAVFVVRQDAHRDKYGDKTETVERRVEVRRCHIAPRFATEQQNRERQGTVVGFTLYAPVGTDIVASDRVEADGILYEVNAPPMSWVDLHGRRRGVTVDLKRVEG